MSAFLSRTVAGEWPQILGPHRNGQADEEPLTPWPAAGPRTLWTQAVGEGYAGPAVAEGRVVLIHRVDDQERVAAYDAHTGRALWNTGFPATYRGGIDPDTGPRCVPVVHQGHVYVCGAAGDLHCLTLATGQHRWSRKTYAEFEGNEGYFGAGSSPIVVGDTVLLNVGGRDAGIVAFGLADGRTLWKATNERASYSSPTRTTINGRTHVIFVTRLQAVAVDPATGAERYRFAFGQRGPTVNAATPLVFDQQLFVTASYGVGAKLLRLSHTAAEMVWENDESLSSQYNTPVHTGGYLFGIHGREDVGVAQLRCIAAATGKVQWSVPDFGVAHLLVIRDKLLLLTVDGRLLLAEASPQKFHTLATAKISPHVTRALPALSDGRLYVREHAGREGTLRCLQLVHEGAARR